jgi:two-component system phosphate regulon sensor histidine kinase PhoR
MATRDENPDRSWTQDLRSRLSAPRVIGIAAALVTGIFVITGDLSAPRAIAGLVAIFAVAWIVERARDPSLAKNAALPAETAPAADLELSAIFEGIPDPVVAIDRQGRVAGFNKAASAVAPALRFGVPASIALRMPEVVDAIRAASATGRPQRVEYTDRGPANRAWEVHLAAAGGERGLLLLTFHDLSPLRRLEEMRADFVANASHELRTPLAALLGFIETLQGPAREDSVARERFLGIMRTQATRMARLIDDLLSLSRIELNAHLRPDTPVELVAIVRQVADALQMLARDRETVVNIKVEAAPLIVLGDQDELIRVFENLVENALKYGAPGKRVDITVTRGKTFSGGEEAQVGVRDYGPGIPAEHLPRLTERFYRIDVAESRTQGGTGLGLALVKHILNRHGGRLTITSRVGAGASFTVHLPLQP